MNQTTSRPEVVNTRKAAVLALLSDGQRHSTFAINQVGGTDGTRRLRELRYDGYNIEAEQIDGSSQWAYRLIPRSNPVDSVNTNHASL